VEVKSAVEVENNKLPFVAEEISVDKLKEHPRNYRVHTDAQLEQIMQSIRDHGIYKNIVIANDDTILAGHGVVRAAKQLGLQTVPVKKLRIGPQDPFSLKLLVGDNEISHLAEDDKTILASLLKQIKEENVLLGSGHDDFTLSNLLFLTENNAPLDAKGEWKGMPEYENQNKMSWRHIVMHFDRQEDLDAFAQMIGQDVTDKTSYLWFPKKERLDTESKRY
jgi:hypothetical protein